MHYSKEIILGHGPNSRAIFVLSRMWTELSWYVLIAMLLNPAVSGIFPLTLSLQAPIAALPRHIVTKVNPTFLLEICSVNIPLNVRLNPDQKFPTFCEPQSCVNIFANTSWRIYQFHVLSSGYALVHKIWHLTSENSAQERMSYCECFTASHTINFFAGWFCAESSDVVSWKPVVYSLFCTTALDLD